MARHPLPLAIALTGQLCPVATEAGEPLTGSFDCIRCGKHVTDLAQMTSAEAQHFLQGTAGDSCVLAPHDEQGVIRTIDYATPPTPNKRRRAMVLFATVTTGIAAGWYYFLRPAPPAPAPPLRALYPVIPLPRTGSPSLSAMERDLLKVRATLAPPTKVLTLPPSAPTTAQSKIR
jgi:hypothetical protein